MRGTPHQFGLVFEPVRIIPAHAGNTNWSKEKGTWGADHPRACGEHMGNTGRPGSGSGSSPRMRGTQEARLNPGSRSRIIPAHAGNTIRRGVVGTGEADHPRACGEHLRVGPAVLSKGRIIPAHAGNTCGVTSWCRHTADHPRACGEHVKISSTALGMPGSSPRMRGTHSFVLPQRGPGRIIPAHAGNTRRKSPTRRARSDHPRACGEHRHLGKTYPLAGGSSPRMRGTRHQHQGRTNPTRIIPAHAGNTSPQAVGFRCCSDHPRACGEHAARVCRELSWAGSSPRMRGTRQRAGAVARRRRIIPAHAGNTSSAGTSC